MTNIIRAIERGDQARAIEDELNTRRLTTSPGLALLVLRA